MLTVILSIDSGIGGVYTFFLWLKNPTDLIIQHQEVIMGYAFVGKELQNLITI